MNVEVQKRIGLFAFTLLELMLIATVLTVLLALVTAALIQARVKQQRIGCVCHLKNVGLAYRIFATDNPDLFPWQLATNSQTPKTFVDVIQHFRTISNELSTPKILVCPADTRRSAPDWKQFGQTNISYFVSLTAAETYPQSFLAGDRNITTNGVRIGPGIVKLDSSATNVAWDGTVHRFQGNAAMGDGSVQQLSSGRFKEQITNTGLTSMTLAVP